MKIKGLLLFVLSAALIAGCSVDEESSANGNGNENGNNEDAVTGATEIIVTDEDSFFEGVGEDGAWIIIFEEDMTVDEEVVVEGEFTNNDEPARKLALYEQDEDRNITESFTLTAPSMTVSSENTRLQGGTFVGDVYVEADGFTVQTATVEGNIYFASEEYEASSEVTDDSTVTGSIEVE